MKKLIIAVIAITLAGCATWKDNAKVSARPIAQSVTSLALILTAAEDRKTVADYCYWIATAVRSLSGSVVTPEQFEKAIAAGLKNQAENLPELASLSASLSGIYASFFPSLVTNPDIAFYIQLMNDIATGVEAAARVYAT